MKKILTVILLACIFTACADKAAEIYETARFEELQNNKDHAMKLYREVVEKHPASAQAKEAEKRLAELQK
ncbi:MAG: hypothetical protein C0402_13490 [Thermodesulfovibrio sp.]|nr:hypothetical protein [Thermodesulfovibrio sp.]